MSVGLTVVLALGTFLLLLLAEMPIALALIVGSALGLFLLEGGSFSASTLGAVPFESTSSYSLLVVPMFVLMGSLMSNANIAGDIFSLAAKVTKRIPGGLGIATVASSAGFSAVVGSTVATVATVGRVAVGEMTKRGYTGSFAAGIVAAAGTLGVLIPPSIILVFYGILTGESIGALLIAAIVPGIVTAVVYAATIILRVKIGGKKVYDPEKVARDNPEVIESSPLRMVEAGVYIGLLFVVVMGGMYFGFFTATEAAAIGAFVAGLALMFRSMTSRKVNLVRSLVTSFKEAAGITSMIFALLIGGAMLTTFLVAANVPSALTEAIVDGGINKYVVLLSILGVGLILGAVLDGMSILLLMVPIAYPVVTGLGFEGVWFGIMIVKMVEIGVLTPPVGINVFVVAGVAEGVTVEEAFKGVTPFIIAELVAVAIFIIFPELIMWLPEKMA